MDTMIRTGIEQCPKTLGLQNVVCDIRKSCMDRLAIREDFLHACIVNNAGSEIMNKIRLEQYNVYKSVLYFSAKKFRTRKTHRNF